VKPTASASHQKQNLRARNLFLVLVATLLAVAWQSAAPSQQETTPVVFELELPELQIASTNKTELVIPNEDVSEVLVHVLKPVADNIDYSQIRTSINGQAAGAIAEIVSGARGKMVKLRLKSQPGFQLTSGRNTVEVWAQNRRGRLYYASFVLTTATDKWNEDFTYEVQVSPRAKNALPPQVVLFEPETGVEFSSTAKTINVKISGIATAATDIKRVSIDSKNVPVRRIQETMTRQLTRVPNVERGVSFDSSATVTANSTRITIEAEDDVGSLARVIVPIITRQTPAPTRPAGRKYALIVGISQYKNSTRGIRNLEYADVDARAVYNFLQQPEAGGFARENMLLLMNEQATLAGMRQALTSFIAKPTADDLLVIFVAAHGAPDPATPQNLYVIAYDTAVPDMAETALAMADLRRFIEQNIKCKRVILLLDTCHSAGLATDATRDLGNNLTNLYLEKLLYQEEGRAIITSSDVNEPSHESERWGNGHGVFTYYLLQGLKGEADANRDRLITVGELFRYVRQKVRLDTHFQQNPRMLVGDNENLAIAVARSQAPR
jgi:Caspase domain